jgi:hypothetical protein
MTARQGQAGVVRGSRLLPGAGGDLQHRVQLVGGQLVGADDAEGPPGLGGRMTSDSQPPAACIAPDPTSQPEPGYREATADPASVLVCRWCGALISDTETDLHDRFQRVGESRFRRGPGRTSGQPKRQGVTRTPPCE